MSEISKQALLVDNSTSFPNNNVGAISPADLRAFNVNVIESTVNQTEYTSNSGSWNSKINQLNAFTASQQPSFTALNSFTASQLNINSGVNSFTQSANQELDSLSAWTGSWNAWTSSINEIRDDGVLQGYSTRFFFNGLVSASIVQNVGGPIANVTIEQDGTKLNTSSFNSYTASTAAAQTAYSASVSASLNQLTQFSASQNVFNVSITSSVQQLLDLSSSLSGGYATQGELDYSSSVLQANIDTKLNTSSFNSFTASFNSVSGTFATTGSNTFTGDQTLIDNAGNFVTLTDASGSLMLVAKGFTSASLHLSASAAGIGNLIFKNTSATADTIISGSANIFPNPTAQTAGFKRYIGGSSNYYSHGAGIPQISGSMAFSPAMNANILSNNGATAFVLRGPVSSSAYTINGNIGMGTSTFTLGTSAANHFERAVSGLNMNGNALFNGNISLVANTTPLSASVTVNGNLIFGGAVTLNLLSSSVVYASNVTNGGFTVNNRFLPAAGTSAAAIQTRTSTNTIYGTGHVLNVDGTNVSTTQGKSFSYNILAGTFLTASVPTGDNSNMLSVGMIGNGLVVTGSTLPSTFAGPDLANSGQGSLFAGRFNSLTGTSDMTAETVFAVGTGTSFTNRKTGFLIDSGSNTFVEGTITISGSSYGNVFSSSIATTTASLDLTTSNFFTLTLVSGSTTHIAATNIRPGQTINLLISQPAVGTGSVTYNSTFKFPAGANYIPTPITSSKDIITLITYDSSSLYATSINNLA